jgi:prolyl-tRNA synthetase
MSKKLLPKKSEQPAEWYTKVIQLSEMADYGPVRGTMIMRPYGYRIWELTQVALDEKIKAMGVENCYFPQFIPMSYLEREKQHVAGFAPELAVVTHGGGEELEEPLAVRPTSETIMYETFGKWVQSWRDLPIKVNQWCNVVRWEKRTMLFLRTSEFLWQEGHTAHLRHEEAKDMQQQAMDAYTELYRDYFAIDGYVGNKSVAERFAGADDTLTFEALMPSGKALQSCTSHDLGQNFAKTFNISYQSPEGEDDFAWQTSWGLSTRSIGGLIMAHGDDNGLVLPPKIAPTQVVIVPVQTDGDLLKYATEAKDKLQAAGIRVQLDSREDERFGFKLNKWEVKGVPLIIKLGNNEMNDSKITIKRRLDGDEKTIQFDESVEFIEQELDDIQAKMLAQSARFKEENTREAKTFDEMKEIIKTHRGFVKVHWNDDPQIEAEIKEKTKAESRCRLPEEKSEGTDFYTGKPAKDVWLFAMSY